MAGLELRCKLGHLERQVVFPELHGLVGAQRFVGSFGCAPQHAEGMELADVGRSLAAGPGRADALEVGGEAVGVADECDALAFLRESAGLLHCKEGLAAASATTDLDAMDQTGGVEDDALVLGERVSGILVGKGARDDVALR